MCAVYDLIDFVKIKDLNTDIFKYMLKFFNRKQLMILIENFSDGNTSNFEVLVEHLVDLNNMEKRSILKYLVDKKYNYEKFHIFYIKYGIELDLEEVESTQYFEGY